MVAEPRKVRVAPVIWQRFPVVTDLTAIPTFQLEVAGSTCCVSGSFGAALAIALWIAGMSRPATS